MAELVRRRCADQSTHEKTTLAALTRLLSETIAEARQALTDGLKEATSVVAELRSRRRRLPSNLRRR